MAVFENRTDLFCYFVEYSLSTNRGFLIGGFWSKANI